MKIAFILTMPGRASWNGRWSGEDSLYCVVKTFGTSKAAKAKAEKVLEQRWYSYGWSDGWRASIEVKKVDSAEARKLQKKSQGFCSYNWMIDSILEKGRITTEHDEKKEAEAVA